MGRGAQRLAYERRFVIRTGQVAVGGVEIGKTVVTPDGFLIWPFVGFRNVDVDLHDDASTMPLAVATLHMHLVVASMHHCKAGAADMAVDVVVAVTVDVVADVTVDLVAVVAAVVVDVADDHMVVDMAVAVVVVVDVAVVAFADVVAVDVAVVAGNLARSHANGAHATNSH